MLAVIDNYDSFTWNLVQILGELGAEPRVFRNDEVTPADLLRLGTTRLVVSPGPCTPAEAGISVEAIRRLGSTTPTLGVCLGHQAIGEAYGGRTVRAARTVHGKISPVTHNGDPLFSGIPSPMRVARYHSLVAAPELPDDLVPVAWSADPADRGEIQALRHREHPVWGVQFHPEVAHTPRGQEIVHNFLFRICACAGDWTAGAFVTESVERIRALAGAEQVVCGLSGGVDSSVAAALVHRAVGDQLTCIFVDTGMMRLNERRNVERTFREHMGIRLVVVEAAREFLDPLEGVVEPERKRKIIGETFIRVFERTTRELGSNARFLVQGTLYPDVIESLAVRGPSDTIKSHHNVGGLPEDMPFELIEPLRELFKDEVRAVGRTLGLNEAFIRRHPFPGPGLAIRVIGRVTEERLDVLRRTDAIYLEEIEAAGIYDDIWQAFAVLLPVRSVGVMGDSRTYENVVALRAVTSRDGMTADWYPFEPDFLGRVSTRIINEVAGVNRVTYDISSKPPATIEWE